MDKGLLIVVLIGIAFMYFAVNAFKLSSSDDDTKWSSAGDNNPYAQYYEKDALGDDVLNFSSISLTQAKSIWPSTTTGKTIASLLPDFELAKTEISNHIADGTFKKSLLKYLEGIEKRFLSGEISGNQTQNAILRLK